MKKQRGQTMTEYVLITAVVVVVIIAAFRIFGPTISGALNLTGGKVAAEAANTSIAPIPGK